MKDKENYLVDVAPDDERQCETKKIDSRIFQTILLIDMLLIQLSAQPCWL